MATKNISDENFEAEVLKADKPVIVDFWAEWCLLAPIRVVGAKRSFKKRTL
jgi:thioredoxin 1